MKKFLMYGSLIGVLLISLTDKTSAISAWARKYGADCNMCHSIVPALNKVGYDFRAAGFRMPDEIGQDEKPFKWGDFLSVRFQQKVTSTTNKPTSFVFHEVTLYPLAGSWGKNFGSLGELSVAPDEGWEFENTYVRAAFGDENGWFHARLGIMHAWEGFGASDRPIGLSRPLFQTSTAMGAPFKLWSLDEQALEVGYYFANIGLNVIGRISNGIIWNSTGTKGEPAQGGGLTKTAGDPGANRPNYQLFVNFIPFDEGAVSAYFYTGVIKYPFAAPSAEDTFTRFAFYGNYWVLPSKINILGGYEYGKDSLNDNTVAGAGNLGNSYGYFVEARYHHSDKLAFSARYDLFDPTSAIDTNNNTAVTLGANFYLPYGLQTILDYHRVNVESAAGTTSTDTVQLRIIFIW